VPDDNHGLAVQFRKRPPTMAGSSALHRSREAPGSVVATSGDVDRAEGAPYASPIPPFAKQAAVAFQQFAASLRSASADLCFLKWPTR